MFLNYLCELAGWRIDGKTRAGRKLMKEVHFTFWDVCEATNSRVINLLLTKLARDRTWRISALGLFCTNLAALGPYCQDLGPIFSKYGPRAWLIRYMSIIMPD